MIFVSSSLSVLLATLSLATVTTSHPHPLLGSVEFDRRANFPKVTRRSPDYRHRHGLRANVPYKRDTASVLATDHKSNLTDVTNNTDAATLFTSNASCVLAPEATQGPYFVSGEYIRHLDWGIVASGNGAGTDDPANINNTFLRGIKGTDDDGVANGTLASDSVMHVDQFFMDQSLITEPYASNTQELTTNAEDSILSEEADTIDPFLEYVLLGNTIDEGLMMWGSMGIDTSVDYTVSPAAVPMRIQGWAATEEPPPAAA
ncbi:hypothetical protein C8R44DRAFT_868402 [Mycena epipterygia]|nr:hypothetical protein C8R44DRAFT_868402 [Mycena epipterygia]